MNVCVTLHFCCYYDYLHMHYDKVHECPQVYFEYYFIIYVYAMVMLMMMDRVN